jgi:hypothetical protein
LAAFLVEPFTFHGADYSSDNDDSLPVVRQAVIKNLAHRKYGNVCQGGRPGQSDYKSESKNFIRVHPRSSAA